jgi:hypothetical protein
MMLVAGLLTIAAVALAYCFFLEFGAWGRRQVRAGVKERASFHPKKPRAVQLYCPDCGCRADMKGASSFRRHDFIRQPWCPSCKVWIKSPVRVNQLEGGIS